MSKEQYFMLSRCEDGLGFDVLTKEQLLKHLQEVVDEEIDTKYIRDATDIDVDIAGYFPSCSALIIKGKVVVPFSKEVVKKTEIE